jgi:hypothetical protein
MPAAPGLYTIRVQALGRVEARDSLFLTGRTGLQFLVILVDPDVGFREC